MKAICSFNHGLFGKKQKIRRIGNIDILEMLDRNSMKAKILHAVKHNRVSGSEINQAYRIKGEMLPLSIML